MAEDSYGDVLQNVARRAGYHDKQQLQRQSTAVTTTVEVTQR